MFWCIFSLVSLLHYPLVFTSVTQDSILDVNDEQSNDRKQGTLETPLSCYRYFAEQIMVL